MLPTLCGIVSQPAQHSPILVDGAVELITLALAPSGVEAARQIHEAATPAMLQVPREGEQWQWLAGTMCVEALDVCLRTALSHDAVLPSYCTNHCATAAPAHSH